MATKNESSNTATRKELVITRVFNAPRTMVYKAFSEAERLAKWWGPKGFDLDVKRLEFRPGGIFLYSMAGPDGSKMWGRFEYREMKAPERIVFVNSFSDEDGNIIRAPFDARWPLEILNTLTLAEHEGKTTLTLSGMPVNATEEEYQLFESMFSSMQEGFAGTFAKLDDYLATV